MNHPCSVDETAASMAVVTPTAGTPSPPTSLASPSGTTSTYFASSVHVHAECGARSSMEDTHLVIGDLVGDGRAALYAVFDGHAGVHVAEYLKKYYGGILRACISEYGGLEHAEEALDASFKRCDNAMRMRQGVFAQSGGSTAVAVLVVDEAKVYTANCGDAEAVLRRMYTTKNKKKRKNWETKETDAEYEEADEEADDHKDKPTSGVTTCLTVKHKPTETSERERIEAAGGFVAMSRVGGTLAVSRSFGDFDYWGRDNNTPLVIADPHTATCNVNPGDLLVIACDGLFDVFSYEEAVETAHAATCTPTGGNDGNPAQALVTEAIRVRNSRDNVSVIVVRIGGNVGGRSHEHGEEQEQEAILSNPDGSDAGAPMSTTTTTTTTSPAVTEAKPLGGTTESWADIVDGDEEEENEDEDKDKNEKERKEKEEADVWNAVIKKNERQCCVCRGVFPRYRFSFSQWKRDKTNGKCRSCAEAARARYEDDRAAAGAGTKPLNA